MFLRIVLGFMQSTHSQTVEIIIEIRLRNYTMKKKTYLNLPRDRKIRAKFFMHIFLDKILTVPHDVHEVTDAIFPTFLPNQFDQIFPMIVSWSDNHILSFI
jgi:hypothetical protein